jgi:hypothetical protein
MNNDLLTVRIAALERRQSRLLAAVAALALALAVLGVRQWAPAHAADNVAARMPQELTLRRLAIVDAKGTERVVLGAPLPQPRLHGKTKSRGSDVGLSGMLIFDATGTERGGYATDDGYGNAMLTLDARGEQTFLLLAEPEGGPVLRMWDRNQAGTVTSSIAIGANEHPFFNMKQDGKLTFSTPEGNAEATDPRPFFR